MRADDDVFRQHAPMFGHASMFDGESGPDLLTYHIYKGLEQDVLNPAFSVGVEEADVVLMPTEEAGDVQQLLQKGQAVVVVGEGFRADLRGCSLVTCTTSCMFPPWRERTRLSSRE